LLLQIHLEAGTALVRGRWKNIFGISALAAIPTVPAHAKGLSDLLVDIRPYLELRIGKDTFTEPDSIQGLELDNHTRNPSAGMSVGVDLGRHVGVEAALDYNKTSLQQSSGVKAGDYSVTRALAQVRLRYPLWNDRLVPFLLAGGGVGLGEFSGREDFTFSGGGSGLDILGVVGGGFDYFLVDNVALSLQAKYFFDFNPDFRVDGQSRTLTADSVDLTAGLRVYLDHLGRFSEGGGPEVPATDSDRFRGYLAFRGGRGFFTNRSTAAGVEIDEVSGLLGEGAIGLNFNHNWGAEFAVNYSRAQLESPPLGDITGYPVFTCALLGRYRYPLLDGRVVPYVVAGGGIGFGEIGDRDQPFAVTQFGGDRDSSAVAALGGGVDYFIEDNVSVGIEAKYTTLFETDVTVAGVPATLSPEFVSLTAGLRIYYP
jgi:opacity protein-like surface antigen